jgi:hypothetical protein
MQMYRKKAVLFEKRTKKLLRRAVPPGGGRDPDEKGPT